jgi:chemotaxis protein MotB
VTRPSKDQTESGVLVYPRMPLPKGREDSKPPPKRRSRVNKVLIGIVGGTLLGGVVIGMVLRPVVAPDSRIGDAQKAAEEAGSAATAAREHAAGLEKDLDAANAKKREVEKRLEVASKAESKLADSAAEDEKRAKELEGAQKKLAAGLRGQASVAVDGADLRITINTSVLFAKDDVLSDHGKQVVVYGHTDDTPLPVPKPPPAPPPPKKGAKPPPAPPAPAVPPPRFATNWELSADRAVAVVRQLQEASKIDPTRLSAVGYGQYHPISRRDRSANHRIEIVLSPKPRAKQ